MNRLGPLFGSMGEVLRSEMDCTLTGDDLLDPSCIPITFDLGTLRRGDYVIGSFNLSIVTGVTPGNLAVRMRKQSGTGILDFMGDVQHRYGRLGLAASVNVTDAVNFFARCTTAGTYVMECFMNYSGGVASQPGLTANDAHLVILNGV